MRERAPTERSVGQPVLRWVGGKRQLLPSLLPHVPERIRGYYEPFFGGGALFFALAPHAGKPARWENAYVSDINEHLMWAYAAVRDAPGEVLRALASVPGDEATYLDVRRDPTGAHFASHVSADLIVGVRMLYLNRLGFNGLYRVNRRGLNNVPYGKRVFDFGSAWFQNAIRDASERLHDDRVQLGCYDVTAPIGEAPMQMGGPSRLPPRGLADALGVHAARPSNGDFVYCDPPYVPLTATASFTAYVPGGFGWDQQVALRDAAEGWARLGARVLLSNSGSDLVRDLYKEARILTVQASRRVAAKTASRAKVDEVLIKLGDAAWRNA